MAALAKADAAPVAAAMRSVLPPPLDFISE